jgi:hypothetical protein
MLPAVSGTADSLSRALVRSGASAPPDVLAAESKGLWLAYEGTCSGPARLCLPGWRLQRLRRRGSGRCGGLRRAAAPRRSQRCCAHTFTGSRTPSSHPSASSAAFTHPGTPGHMYTCVRSASSSAIATSDSADVAMQACCCFRCDVGAAGLRAWLSAVCCACCTAIVQDLGLKAAARANSPTRGVSGDKPIRNAARIVHPTAVLPSLTRATSSSTSEGIDDAVLKFTVGSKGAMVLYTRVMACPNFELYL